MRIPLRECLQYWIGEQTGELIMAHNLTSIIRLGFINGSKNVVPFVMEVDVSDASNDNISTCGES